MSERQMGVRKAFVGVSIHWRQPDPPPLVTQASEGPIYHSPSSGYEGRPLCLRSVGGTLGRPNNGQHPCKAGALFIAVVGVVVGWKMNMRWSHWSVGLAGYSCDEVSADNNICHPSISNSVFFQHLRSRGRLEPLPAVTGWKSGNTSDKSTLHVDKRAFALANTPIGTSQSLQITSHVWFWTVGNMQTLHRKEP